MYSIFYIIFLDVLLTSFQFNTYLNLFIPPLATIYFIQFIKMGTYPVFIIISVGGINGLMIKVIR